MSRIVDKSGLEAGRVENERARVRVRSSRIEGRRKRREANLEKIQTILIQPWNDLSEILGVPLRERGLVIRERLDSWPDVVVGSSEEPEDREVGEERATKK